jgi:GNAT superfamily N-acetyltransferase
MINEWRQGDYTISTDRQRLNAPFIYNFLTNSAYWAQGRSFEVVQRSLDNSLNFGLYKETEQIGFARVVTDYGTFALIADVFIIEEHRGQALGKWLIETITTHPQLQGLRRWLLATKDAHGLYQQFGFAELKMPERWMERNDILNPY